MLAETTRCTVLPPPPSAEAPVVNVRVIRSNKAVEVTIMAMGGFDGGPLMTGKQGIAILHFINRNAKTINLPMGPRMLGKGRMDVNKGPSYLSPKSNAGYGYGHEYMTAYELPQIAISFIDDNEKVVSVDDTIQLDQLWMIKPDSYRSYPMFFSTPSKPGTYTVRLTINTECYNNEFAGHNTTSSIEYGPATTLNTVIELTNIKVL